VLKLLHMTIIWSLFLGALQGITEVLPISSSAHLVLAPWFFEIKDQGLAFDVALHFGSVIAIIIAFRSEWANLIKKGLSLFKQNLKPKDHDQKMIYFLLLATIPGALAGYSFEEIAETTLRSEYIIIFTLVLYGCLLIYADTVGKKEKDFDKISLKDALVVGFAQALAIIPGTSRSGVTITAGLFRGLKKETAAKFSFMLSAPIILGASLVKIPSIPTSDLLSTFFWAGVISSFVFTLLAIKFILGYVKKRSYRIFAYYRFALAALILILILERQ
jgi:undecaprenyl-diphosphatase